MGGGPGWIIGGEGEQEGIISRAEAWKRRRVQIQGRRLGGEGDMGPRQVEVGEN